MELSQVILGPVVTEKAERMKAQANRTHVLRVSDGATKIDVKNALKKFYDIDAKQVRMLRVAPKSRTFGRGKSMQKRHRSKRAIVTLGEKSKNLDLSSFKNS